MKCQPAGSQKCTSRSAAVPSKKQRDVIPSIDAYQTTPKYVQCHAKYMGAVNFCMSPLQDLIAAHVYNAKTSNEVEGLFDQLMKVPGPLTSRAEASLFHVLNKKTVVFGALRAKIINAITTRSPHKDLSLKKLNPQEVASLAKASAMVRESHAIWGKMDHFYAVVMKKAQNYDHRTWFEQLHHFMEENRMHRPSETDQFNPELAAAKLNITQSVQERLLGFGPARELIVSLGKEVWKSGRELKREHVDPNHVGAQHISFKVFTYKARFAFEGYEILADREYGVEVDHAAGMNLSNY